MTLYADQWSNLNTHLGQHGFKRRAGQSREQLFAGHLQARVLFNSVYAQCQPVFEQHAIAAPR